jgi:hypothetical protein
MPEKYYGDAIWTNHAQKRLADRGLSQKLAWTAFQYPDISTPLDHSGTLEYKKGIDSHLITVVAKKNDEGRWVIISCWVDPPFPGTVDDFKHQRWLKYRHANIWTKCWMQIQKYLLGLEF